VTSIRRFLVVVLLATITLVNFMAALHGYRSSMAQAEELFDSQLADIANVLTETADGAFVAVESPASISDITFQIWRDDVLTAASAGAPLTPIAALDPGYTDVNFLGYRWRAYVRYVDDQDRWLIVAERADLRFALAENVILESILPIVLVLPLLGILVWMIVTRGLRPLSDLAGEMHDKRSDDLSPVAETEPPDELRALTDSINDLLRRLEGSFDRERRFAADAAHELRTPISVLKVQLHNVLRDMPEQASLKALQAGVQRMERSVEQVLMLYRTAPDQYAAKFVELDLAGLARQVIAELYPQLEMRQQSIELIGEQCMIRGDSFALRMLLVNLIGNASKYSGESGEIRVILEDAGDAVLLKVEDSGPGIPVEQRHKVFERFYRIGGDRHDSAVPGTGIGLAVVKHVADIHRATIDLGASDFASGLAVMVRFKRNLESRGGNA
jgi:two-component system sensor histidine kinase QseC